MREGRGREEASQRRIKSKDLILLKNMMHPESIQEEEIQGNIRPMTQTSKMHLEVVVDMLSTKTIVTSLQDTEVMIEEEAHFMMVTKAIKDLLGTKVHPEAVIQMLPEVGMREEVTV